MSGTSSNFFFAKKEWPEKARNVLLTFDCYNLNQARTRTLLCATRLRPRPVQTSVLRHVEFFLLLLVWRWLIKACQYGCTTELAVRIWASEPNRLNCYAMQISTNLLWEDSRAADPSSRAVHCRLALAGNWPVVRLAGMGLISVKSNGKMDSSFSYTFFAIVQTSLYVYRRYKVSRTALRVSHKLDCFLAF
jgi:hypothetical protein